MPLHRMLICFLPKQQCRIKQALRITQGVKTTVRGISNGTYRLKTITGDFLGIGSAESELVKAEKILKQFQADAEMI